MPINKPNALSLKKNSRKFRAIIWIVPLVFASASWVEFFGISKEKGALLASDLSDSSKPNSDADKNSFAATRSLEGPDTSGSSVPGQVLSESERYAGLTKGESMRNWIALENSIHPLDANQAATQQSLMAEINSNPKVSVVEVRTLLERIPESDVPDRLSALKLVQKLAEIPEAREPIMALLAAEMNRVIHQDSPSGDEDFLYLSTSIYLELANDTDQRFKLIDSALLVQKQPWVLDYLQGLRASLVTKYSGQQLMRGVAGIGAPTEQPLNK